MMTEEYSKLLDVTGHKCPVPVLRMRRVLEDMQAGEILKVQATDPMTQIDFPHFCHQSRHELVEMLVNENIYTFIIKKSGEAVCESVSNR